MDITQDFGRASYVIRGYDQDGIVINDRSYTRSVIVMPEYLDPDWPPQSLDELSMPQLERILAAQPEIVLLGTGPTARFPAREHLQYFLQRQIGIEFMDTAAACRTYNLLMTEGRSVAGALLMR